MELQEMKSLWKEMSEKVERQKVLTDKLIIDMTQERYTNRFKKVLTYESFGAAICFAAAIFLVFNLGKLDTWYLLASGIISLILFLLMPVLVLRSIGNIKNLDIAKNTYKETLIGFYKFKNQLLFTQRLSIYLSVILALVALPVTLKIINNKNVFAMEHTIKLWVFIPITFVFLFLYSRWAYRNYKSIANSAEKILVELDMG